MADFPHCDQNVLHQKSICVYCDGFPLLQEYRIKNKINFTGNNFLGLKPCPSDALRGLGKAHVWPGNRPHDKDCTCTLFVDDNCKVHKGT